MARGATGMPMSCSAWATRWASTACTPGHAISTSAEDTPRAAGSRSWAAATSWRTSRATRRRVPRPSMALRYREAMQAFRVLILHGWQGSGPDHWQTWLAGRLRDRGAHVQYPSLPDCDVPCPDRWGM